MSCRTKVIDKSMLSWITRAVSVRPILPCSVTNAYEIPQRMQSAVQPICDQALKLFPREALVLVIAVLERAPGYYEIGYGARNAPAPDEPAPETLDQASAPDPPDGVPTGDPPDEPAAFRRFRDSLLAAFMMLLETFQEEIGARVVQQSGRKPRDEPS